MCMESVDLWRHIFLFDPPLLYPYSRRKSRRLSEYIDFSCSVNIAVCVSGAIVLQIAEIEWMHFHMIMLFAPAFCVFTIALAFGVGPLGDGNVTSKYNFFSIRY
jgi:hypothetical protein